MVSAHLDPPVLRLADGSAWALQAQDAEAAEVVARFAAAMQLSCEGAATSTLRIAIASGPDMPADEPAWPAPADCGPSAGDARCSLRSLSVEVDAHLDGPDDPPRRRALQLVQLGATIAQLSLARGALLLHGALVERCGLGVILAAPGGGGKSTAASLLAPPWRACSDDAALALCDRAGRWRAHPWPTWSQVARQQPTRSWEVQRSLPLHAICFLRKAPQDRLEPVGSGQASCMLMESVRQSTWPLWRGLDAEARRRLHVQLFDNASALARAVPHHLLRFRLGGDLAAALDRALLCRWVDGQG